MKDVELRRISKALADPQRFAVLRRVAAREEIACRDLLAEFSVTPATMSHHLKELSTAGLVDCRKEGQYVFIKACPDVLADYLRDLNRQLLPGRKGQGAK